MFPFSRGKPPLLSLVPKIIREIQCDFLKGKSLLLSDLQLNLVSIFFLCLFTFFFSPLRDRGISCLVFLEGS